MASQTAVTYPMIAPSPDVNLDIDGSIATLTLNIPERHNALSSDNIRLLCQHLDCVDDHAAVRVLLVTGAGHKTFCAGASLDQLGTGALNGDQFAIMTDRLASVAVPTIAAINGSAYGGGAEVGLACDFRIGVEGMRVFLPPARIGLCYPVNGIERFVQTLGLSTAMRMLVASEEFTADQLLELGYLTQLVEPERLPETATALAQRLASYAPLALKSMKSICRQVAGGQFDKPAANAMAQACNSSQDLKTGLCALREKRKPVFNGR